MRRLAFVVALAFGLQGCAALGYINGMFSPPGVEDVAPTPRTQYALADAAFRTVVRALTRLEDELSLSQVEAMAPIIQATDKVLDVWERQLVEAGLDREVGIVNRAAFHDSVNEILAVTVRANTRLLADIVENADKPLGG